jgi:hypothetical protein
VGTWRWDVPGLGVIRFWKVIRPIVIWATIYLPVTKVSGGGPGAILGNYQQQGFEVEYDLEKKRVGFARRKCESLWDRLNRDKN